MNHHLIRFLAIATLLVASVGFAQQPAVTDLASANKVLEEGHHAIERGDFKSALDDYLTVAQSPYGDARVWFNAGTAAYRSADTGRAVLYYSRALRKDPGYDYARTSLAVVSPATNDLGTGFFSQVVGSTFRRTPPGLWFLVAEVFFLIACFSIARFFSIADRDRRGHWLASLAWSFVFCAIAVGIGLADHAYRVGGTSAVVLEDKTITRSEPREESTAQLELPAGTIVSMLEDPQRGFVRFKLADGRSGYIPLNKIERI